METLVRPELFSDIAAALSSRGWRASGEASGVCFALDERVAGGVVRITLVFDPDQPWLLPAATLRVVSGSPDDFSLHRVGGFFCHIDPDTLEWNPEAPDFLGNVIFLADRAVGELHRLQKGGQVGIEDAEFSVHWAGSVVYLDIGDDDWPPSNDHRLELRDMERPEHPEAPPLTLARIVTSSENARYDGLKSTQGEGLVPHVCARLSEFPFPTWAGHPPVNLAQLSQWLLAHRPDDASAIWRGLAKAICPSAGRQSRALMLIETAAGRFGAILTPAPGVLSGHRPGAKLAEALRGNNQLTQSIAISRLEFERVDDDFVLTRNAPDGKAALAGKHIHLLGAGTIGGQLADLLVQAGAGTRGGSLRVFDPQRLKAENLGRHVAGVPALGIAKAQIVIDRLKRQRLASNVSAHVTVAGDPGLHSGADLVIDATAAPNVGAHLSNYARRERSWSLISAAVEGEGWFASAHLYRGVGGEACRTCLEPWIGGRGSHVAVHSSPTKKVTACGELYTPYRAAAACVAAALASELACDWAGGKPHPLYRVVAMPSAPKHTSTPKHRSPRSQPGCACSTGEQS